MGNLIYIDVVSRTAKLEKGLARANKHMKRFRRQGMQSAKMLRSVLGAAFTYLSARAIKGYITASLTAIDVTAKMADRIGESTENLVRLGHAADITGAGQAKLAAGMDVLQKRLGEAKMGMGEGKAALDELGLSVDELMAKSPAEQFKDIADAISKQSSKAVQAAVTAKLFSRANQDLVNTLTLGRAGLEKLGREADALGLSFSRVDAAKVEAANDALTRAKGAARGLANELTIAVAPALKAAADWATDLLASINAIRATDAKSTFKLRDIRTMKNELELVNHQIAAWVDNISREVDPKMIDFMTGRIRRLDEARTALIAAGMTFPAAAAGPAGPAAAADAPGAASAESPENLAADTERLIASLRTREEALAESYAIRSALLDEAFLADLTTYEEDVEARLRLDEEYEADKTELELRGAAARKRIAEDEARARRQLAMTTAQTIMGTLQQITAMNANESRAQFEANKDMAIASAVVSTAAGIMKGFDSMPAWAAWVNAAALVALGAMQIDAIQSTTFGGGAIGGAVAAPPPEVEAAPTQDINVFIEGDHFSQENMIQLAEDMAEARGDGVNFSVTDA